MPEVRPGEVHYAKRGGAAPTIKHGQPILQDGFAGIALKQQAYPAGTGLGAAAITDIVANENYIVQIKGRVYIAQTVTGLVGGTALAMAKGDTLYVSDAGVVAKTGPVSATVAKLGRVTEVAPERGVGAGMARVDLDARDSFV
jgi:hypothetical protein